MTFTPAQLDRLIAMRAADRALTIEIMAQSAHYAAFDPVGKWRSLDGVPQARDWAKRKDALIAEALAEYEAASADLLADIELEVAAPSEGRAWGRAAA